MLAPNDEQPPFYYGRWLMTLGLVRDAIPQFVASMARNRDFLDPRYALMQAYVDTGRPAEAKSLATDTLQISSWRPGGATLSQRASGSRSSSRPSGGGGSQRRPSAQRQQLSGALAGLSSGQAIPRLHPRGAGGAADQPDFPEAYNNIAAAYEDLHEWEAAIAAAREAVRLRPDFQLAKNNLAYSEEQKRLSEKK